MKSRTFDELYREAESHDDYWIAGAVQGFTEEVCRLMEDAGVSRTELAKRLGTSPAYVTKILRGNANFTMASMVKLARALGADLEIRLVAPAEAAASGTARPSSRRRAHAGERWAAESSSGSGPAGFKR